MSNLVLGDGNITWIMPIAAKDKDELLTLAKEFKPYNPDMLEWRIDYFEQVEDTAALLDALKALREFWGEGAIMVTPRHHEENGVREIKPDKKKEVLLAVINSGMAEMVDCEMRYPPEYLAELKNACKAKGVALMISYHDLHHTPDETTILEQLKKEVALGADVCKVSYVAERYGDTDRLGKIICKANETVIDQPIVAISAGPMGVLSRIFGDVFGSCATFVSTGKTHQIHIDDVHAIRKTFELE